MKNFVFLILSLLFLDLTNANAQALADVETEAVDVDYEFGIEDEKTEVAEPETENAELVKIEDEKTEAAEPEIKEEILQGEVSEEIKTDVISGDEIKDEEAKVEEKIIVITPEAKAKQEIADNNYSLSFFVQRMELDLDQLDKAKKISDEDKVKRESLLRSIYMLREQSRELEQQSLEKFKGMLRPEQLAVFEELRKEQINYRNKYNVLAGSVEQLVEREKNSIAAVEQDFETEAKKAAELKKLEETKNKGRFYRLRNNRNN